MKMEALLEGYRVLDLADEVGPFCGMLLADLGMDVIKIEKSTGDNSRRYPPFAHGSPEPEKSLSWIAYNMSKRSVTLDLETQKGKNLFKKLVRDADFVVESFTPGYLEKLGLDYQSLSKINPGLIMTSITPFGQSGPYSRFKGGDLICWGMAGMIYVVGDPDRPPVQVSFPQAYFHAGAHGAMSSLIAHYHRLRTGEGQHIDVSAQECAHWCDINALEFWFMNKVIRERAGNGVKNPVTGAKRRYVWDCKDGHVVFMVQGAATGGRIMRHLVQWMGEEGMAPEAIKKINFEKLDFAWLPQEIEDAMTIPIERFFLTKTKRELFQGAVHRDIMMNPVLSPKEVVQFEQLMTRNVFQKFEQPRVGPFTVPGSWVKSSLMPFRTRGAAPLIGQHNEEILGKVPEEVNQISYSDCAQSDCKSPFKGVHVLEFTVAVVGPLTGRYFAEYGADVVHVESMAFLDMNRLQKPYKDDVANINRAGLYLRHNPNKKSIALNLKAPESKEIIKKLIQWADVVIENFRPGVMEKLDMDYDSLSKIKPDIIMIRQSNFGQTGPYAQVAGFGLHLTALTGLTHLTGWPDRGPSPFGPYTDFICPPLSVCAIIAALEYRSRTGKGQCLDVSQLETALQLLLPVFADYSVNDHNWNRMGNCALNASPHGVFPASDGWCTIAAYKEEEWQSLAEAMSLPKDVKSWNFAQRKENEDEIERLITAWTRRRTGEEVMTQLQALDIPSGIVKNARQVYEDPQLNYRGYFKLLYHPETEDMVYERAPFIMSKTHGELKQAAPTLGEHSEAFYTQTLGMSDEEFTSLMAKGVLS